MMTVPHLCRQDKLIQRQLAIVIEEEVQVFQRLAEPVRVHLVKPDRRQFLHVGNGSISSSRYLTMPGEGQKDAPPGIPVFLVTRQSVSDEERFNRLGSGQSKSMEVDAEDASRLTSRDFVHRKSLPRCCQ